MSKIPSVGEALDEHTAPNLGSGRVIKNLHWIIGIGVILFLTIILMIEAFKMEATDKQRNDESQRQERIRAAGIDKKPDDISGLLEKQRKDGEKEIKAVVPDSLAGALQPLPPLPKGAPTGAQGMPVPTPKSGMTDDEKAAARAEALALKQQDQTARAAPLLAIDSGYRDPAGKKSGGYVEESGNQMMVVGEGISPTGGNAAMADYQQTQREMQAGQNKLAQQKELAMRAAGGSGGVGYGGSSPFQSSGGGSQPSSGSTADSKWLSSQSAPSETAALTSKAAQSPYMVLQGTVITAVLVTEINSDLPGQLTAQVTMDVYDSIRGDHLLIPKGSRLVGQYNNDIRLGQERVMAAFRRLIMPNGTHIDLQGMPISDAQGQSGVTGDVNNHFWKMFGPSLFTAGLAWLFQKNQGDTTVNVYGNGQQGSLTGAAGQILVDTSKKITDRSSNIPPTITIQQGYKFNVIASRDIVLAPYARNSRF